jgi:hypothetical protein
MSEHENTEQMRIYILETTEGQVRKQKQTEQAMSLTAWAWKVPRKGTCQNMETNQLSKGHSLPGECRGNLGLRNKPSKQAALTTWRVQREDTSGNRNKPSN